MTTRTYPMPEDAGLGEWIQAAFYPWFGRPDWWPEPDPPGVLRAYDGRQREREPE